MGGDDRPEIKTKRVYSFDTIIKATKLQVSYIKGTHATFRVNETKTGKVHYVSWNKKLEIWQCDCWHYANRTAPNRIKWGYCSHIMGLLYQKSPQEFEQEAKREVTIKQP